MHWWLLLLIAVLFPVIALLGVAAVSTLGLEPDQKRVKKVYRWVGPIVIAYGLGADSWSNVLAGVVCLVFSHPKVSLPGISRRIDKALGGTV
jgi:hypothetical protein